MLSTTNNNPMLCRCSLPAYFLVFVIMTGCQTSTGNQQETNNRQKTDGFTQIFDGETLNGWKGDENLWRVEAGTLVGEITPTTTLEKNSFIIWEGGTTKDFELKLEYKITEKGNSGINYRSEEVAGVPYALKGYQSDIDGANRYTGQNYEERGRAILAFRGQKVAVSPRPGPVASHVEKNTWTGSEVTASLGDREALKAHIKDDWNEMHLIIKGNHLQHYINGVLMAEITDNDTANRKLSGLLGMQVHVGPPMKVAFRNIRYKSI